MPLRTLSLAVVLAVSGATVVGAQNRQELQMLADLRMLHEQVGRLQLSVNRLAERTVAAEERVDQFRDANATSFADQGVIVDQIVATLATMREKLDDNTTRVSQLTQESTAIRQGLRMLTDQVNALVLILRPPPDEDELTNGGPTGPSPDPLASGVPPIGPVSLPPSPATYLDDALNNYYSGRYELAIEAFTEVIELFPDTPQAAAAQWHLGESYYSQQMCAQALPEYRLLTERYPESDRVADAYLMQGICYRDLGQEVDARSMFQEVIQRFPDTMSANQAEQLLMR